MSNIAASVFEHAVAVNKSDSPGDDPAAENQGFAGCTAPSQARSKSKTAQSDCHVCRGRCRCDPDSVPTSVVDGNKRHGARTDFHVGALYMYRAISRKGLTGSASWPSSWARCAESRDWLRSKLRLRYCERCKRSSSRARSVRSTVGALAARNASDTRPATTISDSRSRGRHRRVSARWLKNGLAITLGRAYGYFHQVGFRHGRSRVPARRPLPQHGMPKRWREITVQAVKDAIAEIRRAP